MNNNSYLMEALLLGLLIYLGLISVDINVTVNVTDKPIMTSVKNVESVQNIERKPTH